MKVLATGVQRIAGTSSKGNAFDMCQMLLLVPVEIVSNAKVKIIGHGLKAMEIALDPAALDQFAGIKFPCNLDVMIEPRPNMGKFESTVVGILKAA